MNKLLIIIDMQNDFITGSLANPEAQKIVNPICDFVEKWDGDIICTLDTHQKNYLKTTEGKNLPIKHCIVGTKGHEINEDIWNACLNKPTDVSIGKIQKPTFGYKDWGKTNLLDCYSEFVLIGTCTDICVVSNAIILKTAYPDTKITVLSNLCAGLTKEKHEAALETMRSCQINVE